MARSRVSTFVVSAALAIGAISTSGCSRVRDDVARKATDVVSAQPGIPHDPRVAPDPSSEKLTLKLAGVVDGDTIRVVDATGKKFSVRLIGIDSPESNKARYGYIEVFGAQAKAHMGELLRGADEVALEFDATQDKTDRRDRLLAYVWTREGECLNYRMVADGFAWEFTYHVPYRLQAPFRDAAADARAENRGLWAPGPAGCGGRHEPVPDSVIPEKPARKR